MGAISAGLLMVRLLHDQPEYFLVHPGGPYFIKKDLGSWSIPKGLPETGEHLLDAAIREFREETGLQPQPPYFSLGYIKQKGGKMVHAWAFQLPPRCSNWDPQTDLLSNTFQLEWPPRSGRYQEFPEIDQAGWFSAEQATEKINPAQIPLLERAATCGI